MINIIVTGPSKRELAKLTRQIERDTIQEIETDHPTRRQIVKLTRRIIPRSEYRNIIPR